MTGALHEEVLQANLELARRGLAQFTFGNASAIDRESGIVIIKPSGVPYEKLRARDLVSVALDDGRVVQGRLRPSSDLETHLALYRAFPSVGGVVHTHSHYATVWAQARRDIPCLGTTHADHFHGPIPVTEEMTPEEIAWAYEANTGAVIVRRFASVDPDRVPAVLVSGHAPFCWGRSVASAVEVASVLEEVARMAWHTMTVNPAITPIAAELLDRHFLRKHGSAKYYGQE
ncbi:MAG: L-ribulose-5-phosphate 4-epimerase AraD [Gemmatimonadaceae bacterium]